MLTQNDIKKLRQLLATKDDLKRFSTKEDIISLRQELKKFATKKDLEKYASNEYVRKLTDELIEFIQVTNEVTKKEIIEELGGQTKQFAKEVSTILTNHEGRIRKVEIKTALN